MSKMTGVRAQPVADTGLTLADRIAYITSVCFLHIRQLRLIRRSSSSTFDAAHSLAGLLPTADWTIAMGYLLN